MSITNFPVARNISDSFDVSWSDGVVTTVTIVPKQRNRIRKPDDKSTTSRKFGHL